MKRFQAISAAVGLVILGSGVVQASPYASNVSITGGTSVSFILNEGGSTLTYSINGGSPIALDGTTKGTKSFALGSATDTFSITASKTDNTGWSIRNGTNTTTGGLSQPTPVSGLRQLSTDTDNLVKFNSPRGVSVQNNPNLPTFGTSYIANSATGTAPRTLGDGLYAIHSDQTDGFGYGNTAKAGGLTFTSSTSSPFKITAGSDGKVYVADFSDATGQIGALASDLNSGGLVLSDTGGPRPLPSGRNHGSTHAVVPVIGAGGSLTLYTLDEDLTTNFVTGAGSTTDYNSVWKYSIGTSAQPYSALPTKNGGGLIDGPSFLDLDRGNDGKLYFSQGRAAGAEAGLFVVDADGNALYNSLDASRTLLANPSAIDILTNVNAITVSPDQKYIAALLNNNGVVIIPLVAGLPDLANRVEVTGTVGTVSARDISFDAAGNLHYVSSGQALYRVLSPGGVQSSTLSFDGTSYSFSSSLPALTPEPTTLAALGLTSTLLRRRRK